MLSESFGKPGKKRKNKKTKTKNKIENFFRVGSNQCVWLYAATTTYGKFELQYVDFVAAKQRKNSAPVAGGKTSGLLVFDLGISLSLLVVMFLVVVVVVRVVVVVVDACKTVCSTKITGKTVCEAHGRLSDSLQKL